VPGEIIDNGAKLLKPVENYVGSYLNLWTTSTTPGGRAWHAMNTWVRDIIPMAGAYRQLINEFYKKNRLMEGTLVLRDVRVDLGRLRANLLNVIAEADHITPPCQSEGVMHKVGSQDKEMFGCGGHIGMMAGSGARGRPPGRTSRAGWQPGRNATDSFSDCEVEHANRGEARGGPRAWVSNPELGNRPSELRFLRVPGSEFRGPNDVEDARAEQWALLRRRLHRQPRRGQGPGPETDPGVRGRPAPASTATDRAGMTDDSPGRRLPVQTATKSFLALTAADLMTTPVRTIPHEMPLQEAARLLSRSSISGAPVVDGEGQCIGVLSSSDFVTWAGKEGESTSFIAPWGEIINVDDAPDNEIRHYMTAQPVTVTPRTPLGELAQKMVDAHIHRVLSSWRQPARDRHEHRHPAALAAAARGFPKAKGSLGGALFSRRGAPCPQHEPPQSLCRRARDGSREEEALYEESPADPRRHRLPGRGQPLGFRRGRPRWRPEGPFQGCRICSRRH
jgi:CBS domain-containing protein